MGELMSETDKIFVEISSKKINCKSQGDVDF